MGCMSVALMSLATNGSRQGEYDGPISFGDLPARGYKVGTEDNHADDDDEGEKKGEPEAAVDAGALDDQVGALHFHLVACQVMLYEKRYARRAVERWIPRPPKNKKLQNSNIHE
jgi:hypothetical protein